MESGLDLDALAFASARAREAAAEPAVVELRYVLRWSAPAAAAYEAPDGRVARMVAGENRALASSRAECAALARAVDAATPGEGALRYDAWKLARRADGRVDASKLPPFGALARGDGARLPPPLADGALQSYWDGLLGELEADEIARARDDVDDEFAALVAARGGGARPLDMYEQLERAGVEVIGGARGRAPCRLCNGKGFRRLPATARGAAEADKEGPDGVAYPRETAASGARIGDMRSGYTREVTCEWCGGAGYQGAERDGLQR